MAGPNTDYPFTTGNKALTDLTIAHDASGKIFPDPGADIVAYPGGQDSNQ